MNNLRTVFTQVQLVRRELTKLQSNPDGYHKFGQYFEAYFGQNDESPNKRCTLG
jgi:hypothetical protein